MEVPALGLTKLSFIYFFRRIFNTRISKWYSYFTSGMIMITIVWTAVFFLAYLFICGSHPQAFWSSRGDEIAHCVAIQSLHAAFVISDLTLDIFIMSMSIPIVSLTSFEDYFPLKLIFSRCGAYRCQSPKKLE